ncbi:hypothetical protein C8R47DRAFT_1167021 [Mycena vitilis]|nr:hypothetical protein C8R47DRAFT_1167021 [Mycena vitilis]
MAFDQLRLIGKVLTFVFPFLGKLLLERVVAVRHRWTYKLVPGAKNVVVLGGSFAGIELAKRLAETLPTGFKAVWIEKNSHLNYSFAFPRFSVARGYEHKAFIPYDGVAKSCPPGILTRVQNTVVDITASHVALASGEKIDYEYLAIATGSSQPLPVQVAATERADACAELRSVQDTIRDSQRIALVGGGAVGIQLASDIKSFYPDKEVTLVHSRGQLLNHFGKRLHDYVLSVLREQKISVLLNERPQLPPGGSMSKATTLKFSDGHEESFDLVVRVPVPPFCSVLISLRWAVRVNDPIHPSYAPCIPTPSPRRHHAFSSAQRCKSLTLTTPAPTYSP